MNISAGGQTVWTPANENAITAALGQGSIAQELELSHHTVLKVLYDSHIHTATQEHMFPHEHHPQTWSYEWLHLHAPFNLWQLICHLL